MTWLQFTIALIVFAVVSFSVSAEIAEAIRYLAVMVFYVTKGEGAKIGIPVFVKESAPKNETIP